jgi:hypothetical protein
VPDRADVDTAADQFRPFGLEVARNEAQVTHAAVQSQPRQDAPNTRTWAG